MNTYVTLHVAADGEKASEVTRMLKELGFGTTLGNHDFAYRWKDRNVTPETVITFVDRVQSKRKGTGVLMHFTTVA
jgi:hypothetical protein